MATAFLITGSPLNPDELPRLLASSRPLSLSEEAVTKIQACRSYLDQKLKDTDEVIYGINTGFGGLCDVRIGEEQLKELQENLVLSHAAGTGDEVPEPIVRLMLLLKIHALALGYSAIHPDTVRRLMDFYNQGMLPVVFQLGSLGASGDLAPLAHLSLPLIGKGQLRFQGKKYETADLLSSHGMNPLTLHSKEGLALLNGTQFMAAYGIYCMHWAERLIRRADCIAAISTEAFGCRLEPFWPQTHRLRPHPGQVATAALFMDLFQGSQLAASPKEQVQDPYSFRCIPQVHGATKDTLRFFRQVLDTEANAVTDNPILFPEEDLIVSGGNFHGQPLALVMDYLAIAMGELGNVSERRVYLLVSGQRKLPPFLVKQAGLHSGLMIAQYTAASLVSQNKQLSTPASVDSITSSNGQEDHVSMGANAATKLYQLLLNLERILSIELLTAAQALDFRRPLRSSAPLERIHEAFRREIPFMERDREIWKDIEKGIGFLRSFPFGESETV
ncbi:MAG TPA: histidine ammonia-lyase [Chitinophagaceae bacterium]|nr:histidine ammonia-lyase [Chitinophagaceae bacterium]